MLIGVIDSGIGGLEIINRLDQHNQYILLMDKAFFPYGNRTKEFLLKRSFYLIQHLISIGVDKVILGCNTLSIVALDFLRYSFDIEIEGVFEPLVRYFKKGNIFIGTRQSVKYVGNNYNVDCVSVETLINMIEKNMDYKSLLNKYNKYIFKYYNNVILGCTHLLSIPHKYINSGVIDQFNEEKKLSIE
jgi:glutamate racemase